MEITRESTAYVTGTDKDFPDCARQLLSNFWRLEQLFAVPATRPRANFAFLSNFEQNIGLGRTYKERKTQRFHRILIFVKFVLNFFFLIDVSNY